MTARYWFLTVCFVHSGVLYLDHSTGEYKAACARRAVILAAGALGTASVVLDSDPGTTYTGMWEHQGLYFVKVIDHDDPSYGCTEMYSGNTYLREGEQLSGIRLQVEWFVCRRIRYGVTQDELVQALIIIYSNSTYGTVRLEADRNLNVTYPYIDDAAKAMYVDAVSTFIDSKFPNINVDVLQQDVPVRYCIFWN